MAKEKKEGPIVLLTKFIKGDKQWEKNSLQGAIFWTKVLASFIIGFILGIFGIKGAIGNIVFLVVCIVGIGLYTTNTLQIDPEEMFGSPYGAMTASLMQSFAAFLLSWSFATTLLHT